MIRSMTGFGRAQETVGGITVTVEVKVSTTDILPFPAEFREITAFLKKSLKALFSRGLQEAKLNVMYRLKPRRPKNVLLK